MPISLSIPEACGDTATYHVITAFSINALTQIITLTESQYLNKAVYGTPNSLPLATVNYDLPFSAFNPATLLAFQQVLDNLVIAKVPAYAGGQVVS